MAVDLALEGTAGAGVDRGDVARVVDLVLADLGLDGALGVHFVDEARMQALNAEHRGHDGPTDVLSFPMDGADPVPDGMERQLGDVVICLPEVARQAEELGVEPSRELALMVIHGVLHLAGYDHEHDAGEMLARQDDLAVRAGGIGWGQDRAAPSRRPPDPPAPSGGGGAGGPLRAASVVQSLNFAFEGIIHVLRTQRNMRLHFGAAAVALVAALALGVTRAELLALTVGISFVLIAEMLNTALEQAIDIATNSLDPRAKVAKDCAAGAVLIAAANALVIAYLVFADRLSKPDAHLIRRVRESPLQLSIILLVLVVGIVITTKAISGTGTPLRGGLPSGHAAVAFAVWASVTFITSSNDHHLLISSLTLLLALLVVQTRVESGIHSVPEVIYGGVLGALLALVMFQLWS
jgi:diacylglycerol kinase (ATP)